MVNVQGLTDTQQTMYRQLLETGSAEYVSQSTIDKQLDKALQDGLSFDKAVQQVKSDLPNLKIPTKMESGTWKTDLAGLPSFGANYLAMITDLSSEQRRQNAEVRAQATEEMVAKINEQASELRNRAVQQLAMGIATGALSIAQGAISTTMTVKGMAKVDAQANAAEQAVYEHGTAGGTKAVVGADAEHLLASGNQAYSAAQQTGNMLLNTRISAFSTSMGGVNTAMSGLSQALNSFSEARQKEKEGDVERIRATQQQLDSLDENLKAVIQKALSSMDAIQQNMNQTRTKILG